MPAETSYRTDVVYLKKSPPLIYTTTTARPLFQITVSLVLLLPLKNLCANIVHFHFNFIGCPTGPGALTELNGPINYLI